MEAITGTVGITPTLPLTGTYISGAYGSNVGQTLVDYAQVGMNLFALCVGVWLVFMLIPRGV